MASRVHGNDSPIKKMVHQIPNTNTFVNGQANHSFQINNNQRGNINGFAIKPAHTQHIHQHTAIKTPAQTMNSHIIELNPNRINHIHHQDIIRQEIPNPPPPIQRVEYVPYE